MDFEELGKILWMRGACFHEFYQCYHLGDVANQSAARLFPGHTQDLHLESIILLRLSACDVYWCLSVLHRILNIMLPHFPLF